jgi:exodeoxyribonuclease VII small subunit
MPKAKPKPIDELTFEAAFDELEDLVRQLEEGAPTLDEALALFERGQALSARCQALLETAELKVQQLTPRPGGGYSVQPFEADER